MQEQSSKERESDLDDIIATLDGKHTNKLPRKALRIAQGLHKEISPRLIDLIRQATQAVRAGNRQERNGHLFALYLLTEFQAKEALPTIREAVTLPGEGPFELFGDAITEDLSRVLAALAVDSRQTIDELIANRSLNEYVRWKATQTYLFWVRDGLMTRDRAVQCLREHLYDANKNRDTHAASALVAELVSYSPSEAMDEIKEAFRRGLVDQLIVGLDSVKRSIAEGESRFWRAQELCPPTGVADTVAELRNWACFR